MKREGWNYANVYFTPKLIGFPGCHIRITAVRTMVVKVWKDGGETTFWQAEEFVGWQNTVPNQHTEPLQVCEIFAGVMLPFLWKV